MRATVLTPAFQSGSLEVGNTHDMRATVLTPAFQSGLLEVDNTHDVRATVLTPAFQSGLPNVDDADDMGRQYLRLRSGRDRQKCVIPATLAHNPSSEMRRCIATSVSITPGLRHKGSPSPSFVRSHPRGAN